MQINPADVKTETFTTEGAWSTKFNGVKLTYVPTGDTVYSYEQRSQWANRDVAWEKLIKLISTPNQLELEFEDEEI